MYLVARNIILSFLVPLLRSAKPRVGSQSRYAARFRRSVAARDLLYCQPAQINFLGRLADHGGELLRDWLGMSRGKASECRRRRHPLRSLTSRSWTSQSWKYCAFLLFHPLELQRAEVRSTSVPVRAAECPFAAASRSSKTDLRFYQVG